MRATLHAADRRAVPVHLIRVDAIDALLDQEEPEVASLLFACELELEQLPIGSACLRAVVRCPEEQAEELEQDGDYIRRVLRRAIEQALPRGWELLALETRVGLGAGLAETSLLTAA
jgi:hypothetical protein